MPIAQQGRTLATVDVSQDEGAGVGGVLPCGQGEASPVRRPRRLSGVHAGCSSQAGLPATVRIHEIDVAAD